MTKKNNYKLKKHITLKGYPITSKDYPICHREAIKKEIERFGLHKFHQLGGLIPSHSDELFGTNTQRGHIFVSSVVPKKFRDEVYFHEKQEMKCLLKRRHN